MATFEFDIKCILYYILVLLFHFDVICVGKNIFRNEDYNNILIYLFNNVNKVNVKSCNLRYWGGAK